MSDEIDAEVVNDIPFLLDCSNPEYDAFILLMLVSFKGTNS